MQRRRFYVRTVFSVFLAIAVLLVSTLPATVVAAEKITLNTTEKTIKVGETYRLKVMNAKDLVKWTSANIKVAQVDGKGRVKGVASGNTTITAVYKSKKYTCAITVEHPKANDDVEDKMLGPVNICYSKELATETSESDAKYVWSAKTSSGLEQMKLYIFHTAPKTFSYDEIQEQFLKEFKEDKTLKRLEKEGYTDVKLKKIKKSSYKVVGQKAYRASARISTENSSEDRVIYIFSIPNYLFAVTGQALDGGDFSTIDSTIKDILKNMTVL